MTQQPHANKTKKSNGEFQIKGDDGLPTSSDPQILTNRYPDIWEIVKQTRIEIYNEFGYSNEDALNITPHTNITEIALGYCHENSVKLADNLLNHGYKPAIVVGQLFGELGPTVDCEPAAGALENLHIWVELGHAGNCRGRIVAEPVSESSDAPGAPHIAEYTPENYFTPPASTFWYEAWMDGEIGADDTNRKFAKKAKPVTDQHPRES